MLPDYRPLLHRLERLSAADARLLACDCIAGQLPRFAEHYPALPLPGAALEAARAAARGEQVTLATYAATAEEYAWGLSMDGSASYAAQACPTFLFAVQWLCHPDSQQAARQVVALLWEYVAIDTVGLDAYYTLTQQQPASLQRPDMVNEAVLAAYAAAMGQLFQQQSALLDAYRSA